MCHFGSLVGLLFPGSHKETGSSNVTSSRTVLRITHLPPPPKKKNKKKHQKHKNKTSHFRGSTSFVGKPESEVIAKSTLTGSMPLANLLASHWNWTPPIVSGLCEKTPSVIQQKGPPKDNPPDKQGIPLYHGRGDKLLDPTTLVSCWFILKTKRSDLGCPQIPSPV